MKVIQVGSYPPPYGGVSVHIKRLKQKLEKDSNICEVINCDGKYEDSSNGIYSYKKIKLLLKLLNNDADIIHIHTANKKIRILSGFLKFVGKKIFLTAHSENLNDQIIKSNPVVRKLYLYSLKNFDMIVCVNKEIYSKLMKLGIKEEKLRYIPAYIDPEERTIDFKSIPNEVWDFIKASSFLISGNGNIRFYNEEDLYGLDLLIELIHKLRLENYKVNLLFAVLGVEEQNTKEKTYYNMLKEKINKLNLEENILLFEAKNTEFYPVLKHTNLFIRPTNTDGFPLSLAEALKYKVPSIASDVCVRPEGTIEFKSRDVNNLFEVTKKTIDFIDFYKDSFEKTQKNDYYDELYKLYKVVAF